MDEEDTLFFYIGMLIGILLTTSLFLLARPNGNSDIGLSYEAGNITCQKLTNNSEAYAIDWNYKYDKPKDSLICKIPENKENNLIQIIK